VAKEVVVGSMAQVYGAEEAEEEEAEPTTFFQGVGGIVTGFFGAVWDTIRSIPLIVGIDFFEGEEEAEPTTLMAAVEESFEASSGGHGALAVFAFMAFILLYTPCMVAVAAERQELGSKWMWVSVVGQLVLAWVVALVIFQGGKLLGLG
jgi:ferrous iron transport protein B